MNDVDAAAAWYASLLGVPVEHENPRYAFVRAPHGVIIGFHPTDAKNPGGVPGTTPYWEVADFDAALATLLARGATLHRWPAVTDFGARGADDRSLRQYAGVEPGEELNPPGEGISGMAGVAEAPRR